METARTRRSRYWKSAADNGWKPNLSPRSRQALTEGWKRTTEAFEKDFQPDLWVTLETVKPMSYERGKRLVRTFWSSVCRKYKTHAKIMMFSDVQPNSPSHIKHDYHHLVSWIGVSVPAETIAKLWHVYINDKMFKEARDGILDIESLAVRDYVADVQQYKQKNEQQDYIHILQYALTGHEWVEVFIACHHTGQCKKKGCRVRQREEAIEKIT